MHLILTCCVTSDKFLNFSELQFFSLIKQSFCQNLSLGAVVRVMLATG
jgi:hypothetical protein